MLSVIIPTFNEENMIDITAKTITRILVEAEIQHEIIFVNDGSKDKSWELIEKVSRETGTITGVNFSRNFGKEAAIYAGLYYSKGDCCAVIDCDLQHPPEKIIEMYRLWSEEGYEIVEGVKANRGNESALHSFAANSFYQIMSHAVHIDMRSASDFKLLDRKAVTAILNMKESNAFFRALSSWIGFKTTQVEFEVQERTAGKSKWTTWSLVKYALRNISSFTTAPMQIVTILGVISLVVSLIFGLISLIQYFLGTALAGFTTVIILQLLSSSIIMISLGIIGFYISKIYEEVKNRPKFIVSEICGKKIKA